jgi:DNA processing protein
MTSGADEVKYWLALADLEGVKKGPLRRALLHFGDARTVFERALDAPDLFVAEFGNGLKDALKDFNSWERVEKEMEFLARTGSEAIALNSPAYPKRLASTFDPPIALYARGDLSLLSDERPAVAVVGTRRPSHYGLEMSEKLGLELAGAGCVVTSGMARGCDGAAHRGALSAGGPTVAVLGTGLDVAYPPENKRLQDEVAAAGLVISEFGSGAPPKPEHFPMRNRIISGLSLGVVVVEAPLRSGAIMTANLALDSGRDVMAVPGRAGSEKSAGSNKLIKDGAVLVESADDVLAILGLTRMNFKEQSGAGKTVADTPGLTADERRVASALQDDPLHIDDIAKAAGLDARAASAVLTGLELRGLVVQLPGKTFALRKS